MARVIVNADALPEEPGRFLITTYVRLRPEWPEERADVYAAASAQAIRDRLAWLERIHSTSRRYEVTHEPGLRPVHVSPDWQLWDDGSLSRAIFSGWDHRPRNLSPAADHALNLIAKSGKTIGREVWHPLRDAAAHTAQVLEEATTPSGHERRRTMTASAGWPGSAELTRHDYTLPDGTVSLWVVTASEHPIDGGGEDAGHLFDLHLDEAAARHAYQAALHKFVG